MELTISLEKDFKNLQSRLGGMTGAAEFAMSISLNAIIKKAKTAEKKAVMAAYNINAGEVTKTFARPQLATPQKLVAKQVATGRPIAAYKFGRPTPNVNKGFARPTYFTDIKKHGGKKPAMGHHGKGFVAAVYGKNSETGNSYKPGRGVVRIKKDFNTYNKMAKETGMRSGHMKFFARKEGVGWKPNLPIEQIYSISAPQGMLSRETHNAVMKNLSTAFDKEVARVLPLVLDGTIKPRGSRR